MQRRRLSLFLEEEEEEEERKEEDAPDPPARPMPWRAVWRPASGRAAHRVGETSRCSRTWPGGRSG